MLNIVRIIRCSSPMKKLALPLSKMTNPTRSTQSEATFNITACKLHKLENGPCTTVTLNTHDALHMYEDMVTVRQLELAACGLYKEKLVRGFCHLYIDRIILEIKLIGEEAVAVGIKSMMGKKDSVITSYRCHGWLCVLGVSAAAILSELTSRKTGISRGKGGSMHMFGPRFFGGNGIVGAQVPLGTGIAFANKYNNDCGISFTLYGDGAANQGQVFEAMNIAKLWNLPCVFICENNKYGLGTAASRSSASTEFYKRGDYIPGIWVDGMDVIAVREGTRFAIDYITSGKGPLVVETETYRFLGHSMSDPGTSYRTRDEVQKMRQTRDPIYSYKDKLINSGLATDNQLKAIDIKVKNIMKDAVTHAKEDPEVVPKDLSSDLYKHCVEPNNLLRGIHPLAPLKHFHANMS